MADYERSTTVDASPDEVFEWLVDPAHLPMFLQMLKSADPIPGGLRVTAETGEGRLDRDVDIHEDRSARRFEWHPRGSRYHGAIAVTADGGRCRVVIELHTTDRVDRDQAEQALTYALARIGANAPRAGTSLVDR